MPEYFTHPVGGPVDMSEMYPPRPSRRKPHRERGVSSIVEWLWNIYAKRNTVDLDYWFTTNLDPWLKLHWDKIRRIRGILDKKHKDFLFLSWDDPRMKDPVIYSFGWYELFIVLMTLSVRYYQSELGLNLDNDDLDELYASGKIDEMEKSVQYNCHHIKVAIEILESLEEDYLRKHPIASIYINALNEASVHVLRIYGYGDWVSPITDSKIEGDPIGTFLSWFQQPFSVIRARNPRNFDVLAAQKGYSRHFHTKFGVPHANLPTTVIDEGIPAASPLSVIIEDDNENPSPAPADPEIEQNMTYVEPHADESLEAEECPASSPSYDFGAVPYYHSPPVEMYPTTQDFSSGTNFYEQPQQTINCFDGMGQIQSIQHEYQEQPMQLDSSDQWCYANQYDPYMGFTWDQELNIMA
ncbi:hypothetical protein TWF730_001325 [Orbilia blumenaviensis]|uniref:Uncharacterized protein n=1 Tax=Orbilia blumenaviensis TaxID=1796055 RepID=A0AAV9UIC4_9PEZI